MRTLRAAAGLLRLSSSLVVVLFLSVVQPVAVLALVVPSELSIVSCTGSVNGPSWTTKTDFTPKTPWFGRVTLQVPVSASGWGPGPERILPLENPEDLEVGLERAPPSPSFLA